ncbi:MAG: CBS domain-containing protein [Desulfobacterales bacterium]
MKTKLVKDLMVPLEEYALVSQEATLSEAVTELKHAQEEFDPSRYKHRAILVYDTPGHIVGKIGLTDILRALEPKYDSMLTDKGPIHVGFTRQFQRSMIEKLRLWEEPLDNICRKAGQVRVKSFMRPHSEGEIIEAEATLDEAIHLLVLGCHQSLLVTQGDKIIGILRLTDLFDEISNAIAACEL